MPGESFRFIHASDFHLEKPLGDLDALPSHLQESMAMAPIAAAKRVLEAALLDNIDFVVLCGDLLSPQTSGPHGMSMLLDYFEKLNAQKTQVFWAAGLSDDPSKWPDSVPLPPNVTFFPKDQVASVPVQRGGRTVCVVVGRSCDGRSTLHVPSFQAEPTDEFTVGVGYGTAQAEALSEGRFDYWALGGLHNRMDVNGAEDGGAIYCGSPQGRNLQETGPHGYTIVDVDSEREMRIQIIECDSFRYANVEIDAADIAMSGNLRNLMSERIMRLQHENGGRHLILGWDISVETGDNLHAIGDPEELLQWVRREYGHGTPSAWTAKLNIRPPHQYPTSWTDEETILGDFLRVAVEHRGNEGRELNLLQYTEEHELLAANTATLLAEVAAVTRRETLDQATLLGVDLLRGGKPNWVRKS